MNAPFAPTATEPLSAGPRRRYAEIRATMALPSAGGVALEIARLAQFDEVPVPRVVVLRTNPALTGHLIQLANSVALRGSRPAASVQDAVQRLGFAAVRNIARTIGCQATLCSRTSAPRSRSTKRR